MLQNILMIAFCIILVAYGLVALFKKDWIWKVREFSARLEGKGNIKREEGTSIETMGNAMAIAALLMGLVGIATNVAMLVLL